MGAPHAGHGRVAVLVSGSGSNLQALLDHGPPIEVCAVVADRADAGGLERARRAGVPAQAVAFADFPDRAAWEAALADAVAAHAPDAVVLAGFMRVLSGAFVRRWPMLNVHPSLLPAFPGARAVEAALAHGVKVTGATVHLVEEAVDAGPIVAQQAVEVAPNDDLDALHDRIQAVEHVLLPRCVAWLCAGRLRLEGRHVRVLPADPAAVSARPGEATDRGGAQW